MRMELLIWAVWVDINSLSPQGEMKIKTKGPGSVPGIFLFGINKNTSIKKLQKTVSLVTRIGSISNDHFTIEYSFQ
jgi:hypothetical protein